MMEQQKLLEDKYREDMIYAQLWKRDIRQKEIVERERKIAHQMKVQQRNIILDYQKKQLEEDIVQQKIAKEHEKIMLNEQWKIDDERMRQVEIQDHKRNLKLNEELVKSNQQQREFRAQKKAAELK